MAQVRKADHFPQVVVNGFCVPDFFEPYINKPIWTPYRAFQTTNEDGSPKFNADGTPNMKKVPVDPHFIPEKGRSGKSDDQRTWGTLPDVLEYIYKHNGKPFIATKPKTDENGKPILDENGKVEEWIHVQEGTISGFGIYLLDPLICLDLDHVIHPETLEVDPTALDVLTTVGSYTEFSRSGTGFHVFAEFPNKPQEWQKKGNPDKPLQDRIEMYQLRMVNGKPEKGRFMTLTFQPVEGFQDYRTEAHPEIRERTKEIRMVYNDHFARARERIIDPDQFIAWDEEVTADGFNRNQPQRIGPQPYNLQSGSRPQPTTVEDFRPTDQEVIDILTHIKGLPFTDLFYQGKSSNPDRSAQDLALCNHIAWVTKDPAQIERIFLQSALGQREKAQNRIEDYVRPTIQKAIQGTTAQYNPNRKAFTMADCQTTTSGPMNGYRGRERQAFLNNEFHRMMKEGRSPYEIGTTLWKLNEQTCSPPLNQAEFSRMKNVKTLLEEDPQNNGIQDLRIANADKLRTTEVVPTKFHIEGLIPTKGLGVLSSQPKMGKSWMAMDMALSLASGTPFLGIETHSTGVLYVDTEVFVEGHIGRIRTLTNQPDYTKPLQIPDNYNLIAEDNPKDGTIDPFQICKIGQGFETQLLRVLEQHPEIKFIVIDMFVKIKAPTPPHMDRYQFEYDLADLLRKFAIRNDVYILLVHHNKKGSVDYAGEAISGSNGLIGAVTEFFVMQRDPKTKIMYLEASGKQIQDLDIVIERDPVTARWSNLGDKAKYMENIQDIEQKTKDDEKKTHEIEKFKNDPIPKKIMGLMRKYPDGFVMSMTEIKTATYDDLDFKECLLSETPAKISSFFNNNVGNFNGLCNIRYRRCKPSRDKRAIKFWYRDKPEPNDGWTDPDEGIE